MKQPVAAAVAGGRAHDMASAVAGAAAMDEEDELEHDDSMEVDSHGGGLSGHQQTQANPLRNAITWRALLAHPRCYRSVAGWLFSRTFLTRTRRYR